MLAHVPLAARHKIAPRILRFLPYFDRSLPGVLAQGFPLRSGTKAALRGGFPVQGVSQRQRSANQTIVCLSGATRWHKLFTPPISSKLVTIR